MDFIHLKQQLEHFLNSSTKVVILGIGNDLRGDDALGSVLAQEMSNLFIHNKNVVVLDGKTVPENFTGAIKRETPSHIIIMDAVQMKENPGHIRFVAKEEIDNYSISTHAMPLTFFIKYLESISPSKMILLGIQPKGMELICEISDEVLESMNFILKIFDSVLNKNKD